MSTEPPPVFGALLRRYRATAGLTQEELAARTGLTPQAISLLERGQRQHPQAHTVGQLAKALALTVPEQQAFAAAARLGSRVLPAPGQAVHNLPVALTRLIGREHEQAAVEHLLREEEVRLLTLTGTGGVGKTRLAVAVAREALSAYPDGVWLVELASLAEPGLVPQAVVQALGPREDANRPVRETLCAYLATRQVLLVLDNCEHLVGACAELATGLLRGCPWLRILATSREGLGIAGERLYRVPSLPAPPRDHLPLPEELGAYAAVALFVARAQERRSDFHLAADNAWAVAQVCARLDGLPLAIELAAAWVGSLPVEAIAARLDDRFRLLTSGLRTAVPRQRTLRATLDWSYDLLSAGERRLLDRLSVFAGGCTLDAAEEVCSGEGIAEWEVLDLLGGLVNKSLVLLEVARQDQEQGRYRLLETVRQYGQEQLSAAAERAAVQRRHAVYYLALVERDKDESRLSGPNRLPRLGILERELDNLRAALAWCLDTGAQGQDDAGMPAGEIGLRLAGGLHAFWRDRDHCREGLAWLERALAGGGAAPAAVRALALHSAGILAGSANDTARAQALLAQSIALSREAGDPLMLTVSLAGVGWAAASNGQDGQAAAALEESLALARAAGEPRLIAQVLFHDLLRIVYGAAIERAEERARAWAVGAECFQLYQGDRILGALVQLHLGQVALYEGDYLRARAAFVACLPLIRTLGWRSSVAEGLVGLADVARAQGASGEAAELYAEALTLYRQLGDHRLPAYVAILGRLADVALEQGDLAAAQTYVAACLANARETGPDGTAQLARALEAQVTLAAAQEAPRRAVRLAGAAATLRARLDQPVAAATPAAAPEIVHLALTQQRLNRPLTVSERATLERRLVPARQALSTEEQASAWAAGQAMTWEQAIADALGERCSTWGF